METGQEIFKTQHQGLYCWYPFEKSDVVYLAQPEELLEFFHKKTTMVLDPLENSLDYVIAPGGLPEENPVLSLEQWKKWLKPTGTLLFPMENPLGLKFFCGDQDPFTGRNFDSITGYRNTFSDHGKLRTKHKVSSLLLEAGFFHQKCYSVLPSIQQAQLIYAPDYLPQEDLSARLFPLYHNPDTLFLEERHLYDTIIENGLFHPMANGYFFECSLSKTFAPVKHITLSLDRGASQSMVTVMTEDGKVEKRILFPEQRRKLEDLKQNTDYLQSRGISMISGKIVGEAFVMDYVHGENMISKMKQLFWENREVFLEKMDEMVEIIRNSSDISCENHMGPLLKRGCYDLTPVNGMYVDGVPTFFDQEFTCENMPLSLPIWRSILVVYDEAMESAFSVTNLFQRYNIHDQAAEMEKENWKFYNLLRNIDKLSPYLEKYQANPRTIHSNRQKINYSHETYQRIFVNFLDNISQFKVYVFGSGNYAKEFLQIYKKDIKIQGIIDNNKEKWGSFFEGVEIFSPDILKKQEMVKVLVCIKNFPPIIEQLKKTQVTEYGVFSPSISYKMEKKSINLENKNKPYQRGYVAGVFDLFHIGHLNLIRKAKEQCQYLIVGVVSDEGVEKYKKTKPFISFQERLAIVEACQYVDEAVAIPLDFSDSMKALQLFRFDCQFSGSDYENDPDWLSQKARLEEKGATIVFLPYTESTSSTQLKKVIEKEGKF